MSIKQIYNEIIENLTFLNIDIKGKTFDDVLKELNELKSNKFEGLIIETILKINRLCKEMNY